MCRTHVVVVDVEEEEEKEKRKEKKKADASKCWPLFFPPSPCVCSARALRRIRKKGVAQTRKENLVHSCVAVGVE